MTDVLLTLVPLLLAGAVTLEICVLDDFALNFANIIALPLLLGVGVAFKIYYIMAWRAGKTGLLQSTLTRAVVFSAMTNAVAFGSMWASSYPGMSSMGKMMALALLCTIGRRGAVPAGADGTAAPGRACPGTGLATVRGCRIALNLGPPAWSIKARAGHDWRWSGSRNGNRLGIRRGLYATLGCIGILSFIIGLLLSGGRRDGIDQQVRGEPVPLLQFEDS